MSDNLVVAQAVPVKQQMQQQMLQSSLLVKQFPFPEEPDFVGKYGGNTFSCFDDIETCLFSFCCLPCANGYAHAWGGATQGDGNVGGCMCINTIMWMVFGGACHCCLAADAHSQTELRMARLNNYSALNHDWITKCCCHFLCTGCEQAKLQRAIKNFKKMHGQVTMGQPDEMYMSR